MVNVSTIVSHQFTTLGFWFDWHLSWNKSQKQVQVWSVFHNRTQCFTIKSLNEEIICIFTLVWGFILKDTQEMWNCSECCWYDVNMIVLYFCREVFAAHWKNRRAPEPKCCIAACGCEMDMRAVWLLQPVLMSAGKKSICAAGAGSVFQVLLTRSLVSIWARFLCWILMTPGGWIQASPSTWMGTPSSPRMVIFTVRHWFEQRGLH